MRHWMRRLRAMNRIDVEIMIMDFAEELEIKDSDKLDWFSNMIHEAVENAISDYAEDQDIEDYEPNY